VSPFEIAGTTIFILVLFAGILSIVLGLPGTVIILIDVILYAMFTGFDKIGVKILIILLIISLLAEALDFLLGIAGATRHRTSDKGIWASLIGSVTGAIIMTPVLFGFGTILGSFLGGFAGVLILELIHQRQLKPAIRAGYSVILGRFAGMFVKGFFALVMITITLTNLYS
jgi:uncharacterized protein YqgC (DUF456 family)